MNSDMLQIDRKLDNRRIEITHITLLIVSYRIGDISIKVKRRTFQKRSGYCLDSNDGHLSIGIDEIGRAEHTTGDHDGWELICYERDRQQAIGQIKKLAMARCDSLRALAAKIERAVR